MPETTPEMICPICGIVAGQEDCASGQKGYVGCPWFEDWKAEYEAAKDRARYDE